MDERFEASRELFGNQNWRISLNHQEVQTIAQRERIYKEFQDTCNKYDFNRHGKHGLPILPVLHGTDGSVAEKIAQTGFANLSSLDAGYYGKGIYFTGHAMYTLPYIQNRTPALILSWITPGNVYPVLESHDTPGVSLLGAALRSGYNSHFVTTTQNGLIYNWKYSEAPKYDEYIVPQESQVSHLLLGILVSTSLHSCPPTSPPSELCHLAPGFLRCRMLSCGFLPLCTEFSLILFEIVPAFILYVERRVSSQLIKEWQRIPLEDDGIQTLNDHKPQFSTIEES